MSEPLNVPEDLNHLIEKREGQDRRQTDRRSENGELPADVDQDRRQNEDRRNESRRRQDDEEA